MYEIPLFPLKTVLFPNMPLSLHIFEPRYKIMVEECLSTGQPFGVVLIRKGKEALGPLPEPHNIGCTAQITKVDRLEDGRLNILAIGIERFQIHALQRDKPYLVGTVEPYPLDTGADSQHLARASDSLRPWVERYLSVLSQASEDADFDASRLPDDPLALAYLAAALVQIPLEQKQPILAESQASTMLADIQTIYRREVALLSAILERDIAHRHDDDRRLFSAN